MKIEIAILNLHAQHAIIDSTTMFIVVSRFKQLVQEIWLNKNLSGFLSFFDLYFHT